MRIRARLDVRLDLKWKKKRVQLGDKMYYAMFKNKKLSLFCFICGKLDHGESFCPIKVCVDSNKIVFDWDITLRTSTRGGLTKTNR